MNKSKRTRTRQSAIPVRQSNNVHSAQTQKTIYTTRSDSSDGEITTVRQSFQIIGSLDGDNRNSVDSFCDSNKDSGYDGSQELLDQDSGCVPYSEMKMVKTVSFEDVDTENDSQVWVQPTNDIKHELDEEVGEDEEALKEELLRIFDRERLTLGSFFKHKMEDMTREFKNKQIEMEENSRAERADLENEIAQERAEMQKSFADEIAALTRTFNEERANLEQYYKEHLKELRERSTEEHNEMEQKTTKEKSELQEKLEAEFQAMLRAEIADLKQSSMQEASDREERHSMEKLEMERKHNLELTEAEMNAQKAKSELEMMFAQEKMRLECELREKIRDLEAQLKEESEKRNDLEILLEEEKVNAEKVECEKREENEKFKNELECMQIELDEKNKSSMEMRKVEEEIRVKGKDGLSGRLREDFDRIVDNHKMELERNYQKDKENLQKEFEYQCQAEKQRIQEDLEREKKRLNDDIASEREDLEKSRKHMEEKAKEEGRFSQENRLKYNDNYSGNYHGEQQGQRWQDDKDYREYERGKNDYSPPKHYSRENGEEFSPSRSNENDSRHEARYPNLSFRQPVAGKIQIEYENPSRIDSNDSRHARNDFSCHPLVSEDGLGSHSREAAPGSKDLYYPLISEEKDGCESHSYEVAPDSKDLYHPFVSNEKDRHVRGSHTYEAAADSKDLFYVTPGSENTLRSEINELRRENQGLKAKIEAMEENIDLHRKYKAEIKEELSRLQEGKNELQSKLRNGDMEQTRNRNDELEEKLRESEAKGREFEAKIKELNERLCKAENRFQEREPRAYPFEDKPKTDEPSIVMKDSIETCYASIPYHVPTTTPQPNKDTVTDGDLNNEPHLYECKPVGQENVYGYPSETKSKEYERPYYVDTTAPNCGGDSYRSSLKSFDPSKCDYADRFGSDTDYPRVTRPDLYTSHRTTSPLYGSHSGQSTRSNRKPYTGKDKYRPAGKYSSYGRKTDPFFETSSPRSLKNDRLDKNSSFDREDSMAAKKKDATDGELSSSDESHDTHASHDHEDNYERAVVEKEKLKQLIKELKDKVEELEKEKERIDREEYKLNGGQYDHSSSRNLPRENAELKLKVDEMQRKIKVLADRLKAEKSKNPSDGDTPRRKPYSMQDIEVLQGKLQRTGDVIKGSDNNLDPDVLMRIEREIKSIGDFIRSHYYEESLGGSSYRSGNDAGKVLQLQMEKQELERKLNMAKEAMNYHVARLSDKMEDMQESNGLSDSTLQELYDRNARLKETLRALEKGQHKSEIQNEQLKQQKMALQNLIGQLCKPSDVSFGSQLSSPRHSGKEGRNYGYTMTSQIHYRIPKLDLNETYGS